MKNILVNSSNLNKLAQVLDCPGNKSLDTETYGLDYGKKMFSMMICDGEHNLYFNFHDYQDEDVPVLDKNDTLNKLASVFHNTEITWYMHNAKFDMHRLFFENMEIKGTVHDTQLFARLEYNQHLIYDLDSCVKRISKKHKKDKTVEQLISKEKLFTWEKVEGKSVRIKHKHYEQVPFDVMVPYGLKDTEITYLLGEYQMKNVVPDLPPELVQREYNLTKVCAKMEQRGVAVDINYVEKGWKHEQENKKAIEEELKEISGEPFKNGPKWLKQTFDNFGIQYKIKTETGNPVFDKQSLGEIEHPIAESVVSWRRADKYIGTYYSSFKRHDQLHLGVLHANIKMHGTDTLRFSYSDPNLQNVPKEDEGDFNIYVRKCIVPRDGYYLVAIDYRQQEFRLMLDYAGEKKLIEAINDGADVHQATADMVGVTRKQAKGVNFGLLYGMGIEKLAKVLGVSAREAAHIRFTYFYRLPKVEDLLYNVIQKAKVKKRINTWAGRALHFPDSDFAYKAPNHLIQGGCADMVRQAMVECAPILKGTKSGMIIQVHDELLFEIHKDELDLIPKLRNKMQAIYRPFNGMYMDCSVEVSDTSWGKCDMQELSV